jgi:general secretion pathway protein N
MRLRLDFRLLVFGLLVYLAVLVLSFPAERAYAHWKGSGQAPPGFALGGISGSVWSGKAALAVVQGRRLEAVEWRLRPWALLSGQVALDWRIRLPGDDDSGYGQGSTAFGLDGSIHFDELEARLPAQQLAGLAQAGAVRPDGSVSINLRDLHWDGQSLVSADGRVVWSGAGVNIFKPLTLGDLVVNLETTDEGIKGLISDGGGPLIAEGLFTVKADGQYQFSGSFGARGGTEGSQDLENALRSLGRPGADGKVRVNRSGTLAALGLGPARRR